MQLQDSPHLSYDAWTVVLSMLTRSQWFHVANVCPALDDVVVYYAVEQLLIPSDLLALNAVPFPVDALRNATGALNGSREPDELAEERLVASVRWCTRVSVRSGRIFARAMRRFHMTELLDLVFDTHDDGDLVVVVAVQTCRQLQVLRVERCHELRKGLRAIAACNRSLGYLELEKCTLPDPIRTPDLFPSVVRVVATVVCENCTHGSPNRVHTAPAVFEAEASSVAESPSHVFAKTIVAYITG